MVTLTEARRRAAESLGRRRDHLTDGVETGFLDLDAGIGGFRPGQLVILAARPGMGKSALGLQFAAGAARSAGVPSLFVSLEMSAEELGSRSLAMATGVDGALFRRPREIADAEWLRIFGAAESPAADVWIADTPKMTLGNVESVARQAHARHGLALVVVDYLQYVEG
ncbi:MAG: DnaB-like helicase C-terminal domain-containing protein, partial [Thermoleophilia bacterium]|nr:DnaB-like helicase C-terminal domain-containing protein [Thermoleophilia bacterium]